jgi:aminoglycoside phosphotransferase (APT) family kinase protein
MKVAIDASNCDEVAAALLGDLRERLGSPELAYAEPPRPLGRGTSSFIYAFRLTAAATDAWTVPLVVRILLGAASGPTLVREDAIQRFVVAHSYPALVPFAMEATGDGALGLPFTVVPRIMGGTMLEAVGRNPLSIPRMLGAMAEAHVALHRIPTDGCPLPYDAPLVERRIADWRQRLRFDDADELRRGLAWLEERSGWVRQEEPVICHNDFHPMNILSSEGGRLTIIDWSEAALGDRHHDVARTAALFWFAQLAATGAAERLLLLAVRGFLRGRYLAAYRRQLPLDESRMRYWEAAHAFNGWLQLVELRQRGPAAPELSLDMVQQFTPRIAEQLRRYFWRCTERP